GRSALGEWMEGLAGPHGPVSFWSAYMHLYQHVMPEHKIYDSPRSAPNPAKCGVPDTAQRLVLGLLRSPTQDKPARHRESALN
ncbi:hypothetical protein, partial [Pseudomonas poae]|uniref:hypothetical protein n=1 Tax=Pseudomonas poae TaxID=200451 RepID=UPI001CA45C43